MRVLVTGGAGFIGSHLSRKLLGAGHDVSVLDNFSPQIHEDNSALPPDLRGSIRLFQGDIRDADLCARALEGQQVLIHLAAETGTGQSMYRIQNYSDVNIGGTAGLMELLVTGKYSVQTLIVASSRAVYGEGAARCAQHGVVYPETRSIEAMQAGNFEPLCPICSNETMTAPTSEDAPFRPSSLYGLTKQVQEQMFLMYAAALGLNGFALRYQNVFGPGQSLKNPYTGILAIFANQARANEPIQIFEDGKESRDFVYVDDVVEATLRCVDSPARKPVVLNVGSGVAVSVSIVASSIIDLFSSKSEVKVTGAFRLGDIRHSCASVEKIADVLGFIPKWRFENGLREFLAWASDQRVEGRDYEQSLNEMRKAGLMHG